MERVIKFRGKRIDNGEWVYGDILQNYIHHKSGATINENGCIVYEVDPKTVGQYTGLTDKNGKEIYEGDINQDVAFVIWDKDDAGFKWNYLNEIMPMGDENKWCVIIGSILDNPELLNK